jgi:CO/xanthine dehydrogenase Mo-binding subunit
MLGCHDGLRSDQAAAVQDGHAQGKHCRQSQGDCRSRANPGDASGQKRIDREEAFEALGVSVVEEYGEWKPDGAPMDSFRAMHNGQMRIVGGPEMKHKIAYAFGAEFVEVRVNRWMQEIRVPRLSASLPPAKL